MRSRFSTSTLIRCTTAGALAIMGVAFLATTNVVHAAPTTQPSATTRHAGHGDFKVVNTILATLNLTSAQQTQVNSLESSFTSARAAWKTQNQAQLADLHAKIKAAKAASDTATVKATNSQLRQLTANSPKAKTTVASIRGVLTTVQLTQFDTQLAALKKAHKSTSHKATSTTSPTTAPATTN